MITLGKVRACVLLFSLAGSAAAPATDLSEPEASDAWQQIRHSYFGDRPIHADLNGEVLTLRAPNRAQDAATVPVAIVTRATPAGAPQVKKLYLVVDKNPLPVAGIFTYSPDSGRAGIETRVRIEEYSNVRAIAEMDDGSLFSATRFVKAAGGCSSPTGSAPDFANFKARVRLHAENQTALDETGVVQLMIQHPNTSGLARDQLTQLFIPAYYVHTVHVTYAGKPVLTAEVNFSISENPSFRFPFLPRTGGELKAVILDTKNRQWEGGLAVESGVLR